MACATKEGFLPTKAAHNRKPRALSLAAARAERQDAELAAVGRELAEELVAAPVEEFSSPAERRSAERTARRRQHAQACDNRVPAGARVRRSRVITGPGASMPRDSAAAVLFAVITGGMLGLVLGALSVGGWAIGLAVAGVTLVVLRAFGSQSPSTRVGAR